MLIGDGSLRLPHMEAATIQRPEMEPSCERREAQGRDAAASGLQYLSEKVDSSNVYILLDLLRNKENPMQARLPL